MNCSPKKKQAPPGFKFSNTFDESGEYPYYCLYHPWQTGVVIVEGADIVEEDTPVSLDVSVTASQVVIPGWIKDVAGFWSTGLVSNLEFIQAIEYLIEQEVITISNYVLVDSQDTQESASPDSIPDWFKEVAKFWSRDSISTQEFTDGIKYQ